MFRRLPKNTVAGLFWGEKSASLVICHETGANQKRVLFQHYFDFAVKTLDEQKREISGFLLQHRLTGIACHIVLQPRQYQWLQLPRPAVPDAELEQALVWPALEKISSEASPVLPEHISLRSFFMAGKNPDTGSHINTIVSYKKDLDELEQRVRGAGLRPVSIGIPELCLRNAFDHSRITSGKGEKCIFVVILLGDTGRFLVLSGGKVFFYRQCVFSKTSATEEDNRKENIALEIQRSLDYCDRHLKPVRAGKTVLLADSSLSPGLLPFLESNTQLPVIPATSMIEEPGDASAETLFAYGASVGYAHGETSQ